MSLTDSGILDTLASIDATLKALLELARARKTVNRPAPNADLDGKYGDPIIRFEPRDWSGKDQKGLRFSEAEPDFLEMLAETFDYFADKAERANEKTDAGKPVAPYKRKDAERARGWAARIRAGWRPAQAPMEGDEKEPAW